MSLIGDRPHGTCDGLGSHFRWLLSTTLDTAESATERKKYEAAIGLLDWEVVNKPHGRRPPWPVEPVEPLGPAEPVGDLLRCHDEAGIQLRVLNNLWPYWEVVTASTVGFSGIRLRNARPRP
ncbi:DUF6886 family protein [Micromonospora sp. NPDC004704]